MYLPNVMSDELLLPDTLNVQPSLLTEIDNVDNTQIMFYKTSTPATLYMSVVRQKFSFKLFNWFNYKAEKYNRREKDNLNQILPA